MEKIEAFGICVYKFIDNKKSVKLLLCKSTVSKNRWGFLKGVALKGETKAQTALREFFEESSIKVEHRYLEEYFVQENQSKNIGIYLVNYENISKVNNYFNDDILKKSCLSYENKEVKFFDIKELPMIKKKQLILTRKLVGFLKTKLLK